jgi:hypothetical protein
VREATIAKEATRVAMVHAMEAFGQEATAARESTAALVRDPEARETAMGVEVESAVVLASAHEEAEDLARRIALLEGELAEVRQARDMAKENSRGSFDMVADAERWLEESKIECREHFANPGSEQCLAIVGPPRVRILLSEGMQIAALRYTEMAKELAALWVVVSSAVEFVLECSPNEAF